MESSADIPDATPPGQAPIEAKEQDVPGGGILYDASMGVKPEAGWFLPEHWASRGALATVQGGRGEVSFIREGMHHWVLRHYRRGGLVARWLTDTFLWTGRQRTRSFREWRVLATLFAEGFPVPRPVAAHYRRQGFLYRADLLTVEIPAAQTLVQRLAIAPLTRDDWRRIGWVIARFQRRGLHHADLNAHNLLLSGGQIHVIDFDRARFRASGAWQAAVLARLKRSLEKVRRQGVIAHYADADWGSLLEGYQNGM
jgi:3-deoxy-D-manno-octulosonic acid kinase